MFENFLTVPGKHVRSPGLTESMWESTRGTSASLSCSKDRTWHWGRAGVHVCYTQWPHNLEFEQTMNSERHFPGLRRRKTLPRQWTREIPPVFSIVLESVPDSSHQRHVHTGTLSSLWLRAWPWVQSGSPGKAVSPPQLQPRGQPTLETACK